MGIGTGIALIVIGAILTFAVNVDAEGFVDLDLIGYILMGAGAVVFIISLAMMMRRRQSSSTTRTQVDPVNGEQVTRNVQNSDDPLI